MTTTATEATAPQNNSSEVRKMLLDQMAALRNSKYWAPVGRVDNVWGDRNLSCSCIPVSDYA